MDTFDRILKCKIMLSKKNGFPFFGYLLFLLKTVENETIPTAGIDGKNLYINPTWINKLNDKELRSVLIHECLHIVYGHLWRVGLKDKLLYNVASDIVINNEIQTYNNLEMPKGCLLDPKYKDWFSEQVYVDLLKNAKKIKINVGGSFDKDSKGNSCRGSHNKWGGGSRTQQKKLERKWQRAIKQAAEIAKQKGNLPMGIERLIRESEPKIDWREILLSYVTNFQNDYTYSRPDRRFLSSEFIMPSMEEGEWLEEVVIAIDSSGSIDDKTLSEFVSEVKGLLKSFDRVKIYCCSCDTECYNWQEIDNFHTVIRVSGGGGTDYSAITREIEKRKINPTVLVVLGDMFAGFPQKQPYDVIWLATKAHGQVPDWGRLIQYNHET